MAYTLTDCIEEPDYRYSLVARTDARGGKSLAVVQCNPSRASGTRSDPTVGKVSNWAEENGFGSVTFLNLFARRSPQVHEIRHLSYVELVGPKNNEALARYTAGASTVVLAWGGTLPVPDELYRKRLAELRELLADRRVNRVGPLSGGRYPRHGRAWNADNRKLEPVEWSELLPNNSFKPTPLRGAA
ncbi:MAG: DUF1643 domain-containing protein [Thermomonas hydrothermalis]|uniref:DUF1643 domain-containing protein n=1 Tax=Thermomonas hydrothermalis TaxID=213588 RepID=UPI0023525ACC|nr:DUF1643 domain-containing protein [Thermomonas hydrothermalis]MCL6619303.1 DUF1643 domain-containing protein [Thermomonas hydrothermalis]